MGLIWKALIIDDDPLVSQTLQLLMPNSWQLSAAQSLDKNISQQTFHAIFVDLHLNGSLQTAEGLYVIQSLSNFFPHTEIIAISGDLNRKNMEESLLQGASRFLSKPFSREEIRAVLEKIEALYMLSQAQLRLYKKKYWMGTSTQSENLKRNIANLKGEPGPILIEGESGSGKEIVAQILHEQEPQNPFIAVNLAAIPDTLFESELFGHSKGSFTGALQDKMGYIEAAQGGDLFLDEIETLSLANQAKLLRFLESSEIQRIGSTKTNHVHVRVMTATNQNLDKLVKEKKFREDLYWRIQSKKITIPPLRERRDDIIPLAKFFLDAQKPKYNKSFSEDGFTYLTEYSWPGNIRELKRIVEQLALTSPLPIIRKEDIQKYINPLPRSPLEINPRSDVGLDDLLSYFEKTVIETYLNEYKEVEKTAEALKISKSNLYKKIKDHSIALEEK